MAPVLAPGQAETLSAVVRIDNNDPDVRRRSFRYVVTGERTNPLTRVYFRGFRGQEVIPILSDPSATIDTPVLHNQDGTFRQNGTDFGTIVVGSETEQHTFTLFNRSDEPLFLRGSPTILVTGEHNGDFRVSQGDLPPAEFRHSAGGSLDFFVGFFQPLTSIFVMLRLKLNLI